MHSYNLCRSHASSPLPGTQFPVSTVTVNDLRRLRRTGKEGSDGTQSASYDRSCHHRRISRRNGRDRTCCRKKGQGHGRLLSRRPFLRPARAHGNGLRHHHRRQRPDGPRRRCLFKRLQSDYDGAALPAGYAHFLRLRRAHLRRWHGVQHHVHPRSF